MRLLRSAALAALTACAWLASAPPPSPAQFTPRSSRVERLTVAPRTSLFRYRRPLQLEPGTQPGERTCALLDGQLYAHAELGLSDLRLYAPSPTGLLELPYALTTSDTAPTSDPAQLLNLGLRNGRLSFDLALPARAYTSVVLDLKGQNFLGTATVSGLYSLDPQAHKPVLLGQYQVLDLTSPLALHETTLHLPESTFPYLHIELSAQAAAGQTFTLTPALMRGASVPPDREGQTLYTTVAESHAIAQREDRGRRQTLIAFNLPARVPVEQVQFVLAPNTTANFSRNVQITVRPARPKAGERDPPEPVSDETLTGTISRVHLDQPGHTIRIEDLTLPATIGSNLEADTRVEVVIENGFESGGDQPIPLAAVRLQMRQRKLCFDAPATPPTVFYGAPALAPPLYDYSRLFSPAAPARPATLGPEQLNPSYTPPPPVQRPYTERHPELLWLALLAAVAVLGTVAFRSAQRP